jgi:hypothetical protein
MYIRSIGIAGLILGILFKVQHWPGANVIALAGGLLIIAAVVIGLTTRPMSLSLGLRSLAGVLLTATVVMKMLHWPFADLAFYGAVGTVLGVIILERGTLDPRGVLDVHLPWLLFGSLVLFALGSTFKIMHWPGASIQLVLGMTGCAAWFLITGVRAARTA